MPMEQAEDMIETTQWDDISLGGATPGEARALIRSAAEDLTAETAQRIYEVLRAWVWKALSQRRRDPDLREWHDVIRSTRAVLSDVHPDLAARIATLSDLIYESVTVAETFDAEEVLRRPYVQKLVLLLRSKPLSQEALASATRIRLDRMKLIVNMMSYSDLITCVREDGATLFALSAAGRRAAMILVRGHKAQPRTLRQPRKQPPVKAAPGAERAFGTPARLSKTPSHHGQGRSPSPMIRHQELLDA